MRIQPEGTEAYARKFVAEYTSEVLKAVAASSISKEGPPSEVLVNKIVGSSELERSGPATYVIQDDCLARIRFPLEGNVELFTKYFSEFFGNEWKIMEGAPEVQLKGNRDVKTVRMNLGNLSRELDRALGDFTVAHEAAKQTLIQLANNSIQEKARLEEVLQEAKIQRVGLFHSSLDDALDKPSRR